MSEYIAPPVCSRLRPGERARSVVRPSRPENARTGPRIIRPLTLFLSVLYLVYALVHPLEVQGVAVYWLQLADLAVAGFFLAVFALSGRMVARFVEPIITVCAVVLMLHIGVRHAIAPASYLHAYLPVILLSAGTLLRRWRWFVVIFLVGGVVDLFILASVDWPLLTRVHLTSVVVLAGVVSAMINSARRRTSTELWHEAGRRLEVEHELRRVNRALAAESRQDPLTGLCNRRGLYERLQLEQARLGRGVSYAFVMLDLDGFKQANDTLGHLAADDFLRVLSRALLAAARSTDVVARYGGDEFVVVLTDTDAPVALRVADRLVAGVRALGRNLGEDIRVTGSAGVAIALVDEDLEQLVERADQAAYRAKALGGDCVVQAPPLDEEARQRQSRPSTREAAALSSSLSRTTAAT